MSTNGSVPVTVGIDIGTTATKAVAVDEEGRILARVRRPHELRAPTPGQLEHDAADAWRDGPLAAWAAVREAGEPQGVCVSAMVPSLTAVDGDGVPLGAGLLYGDDRGAALSGLPPVGNEEFMGFVRHLARTHPDAAGFWPAQTVANHALVGVSALDTATAMAGIPLFTGTGWDADLCGELGVRPEQLPALVAGWEPAGDIDGVPLGAGIVDGLAELAVSGAGEVGDVIVTLGATLLCWVVTDTWHEVDGLWTIPHILPDRFLTGSPSNAGGLFQDQVRALFGRPPAAARATEFAAPLPNQRHGEQADSGAPPGDSPGDEQAAAFGDSGGAGPGTEFSTPPTVPPVNKAAVSGASPAHPPAGALPAPCDAPPWDIAPGEVPMSAAPGGVWADVAPGDVPVWIPSIRPERTGVAGAARSASLLGLEATHRWEHIHRAALEASGFVVRRHIEATGITPRRIVATGGGTAVRGWLQALADCCNLPVHAAGTPESAALGAAFAARLVAGLETDLADAARWATTAQVIDPDPTWTAPTEQRYRRFVTLTTPT